MNMGDIYSSIRDLNLEPATMHFNETNLHSIIMQPANAWTNIAYVIIALYLYFRFRSQDKKSIIRLLPPIALLVGITSFIYHSQFYFVFQVMDLSSMFLLSSFMVTHALCRLIKFTTGYFYLLFAFFFIMSFALLILIQKQSGVFIFGIFLAMALIL
ncbi:MAG: ceramidase domain-containing protein, partial [Spirochaetales bacterium]|nr:ceramidase domain-containing protein [Spirochaetales bacterium]